MQNVFTSPHSITYQKTWIFISD